MFTPTLLAALLSGGDPRVWLVDAPRGYLHPALAYARSATIYGRQADGSLLSFAANAPARIHDAALGWFYRMNQSYNQICLRSLALSNAAWTHTGLNTVAQNATSPTGASNDAWEHTETTGNSAHQKVQSITFTSGTTYTMQVIAAIRSGTRQLTVVLPAAGFGSDAIATFDLAAGTNVKNGTVLVAQAELLTGGYWQVSITATATASAAGNILVAAHRTATATVDSYTGDGSSGFNIWSVAVTDTAYPALFVNTAGITSSVGVTTLSATLAALGFSLPGSYTLGVEYVAQPHAVTPPFRVAMQVDNNTTNERAVIRYQNSASTVRAISVTGGSTTNIETYTIAEGTLIKQVLHVSAGDTKGAANGVLGSSNAAALPAGLTNVRIGNDSAGAAQLIGGIQRAYIIPGVALGDAAMQAYTR